MSDSLLLLAQRGANSPVNRWLAEHPIVLGLIFLAIGLVLLLSGLYELRKGVAHDKYGNEFEGGTAMFMSVIRIVGGLVACGFAIYKMING
jgi:uncharacterized membrane protein